jgi:hypothetical protein
MSKSTPDSKAPICGVCATFDGHFAGCNASSAQGQAVDLLSKRCCGTINGKFLAFSAQEMVRKFLAALLRIFSLKENHEQNE